MKAKFWVYFIPLLLIGCASSEPLQLTEESECLAWVEIPKTKVECTGGRGVSPAICVEVDYIEDWCATWWTPKPTTLVGIVNE